MRLVVALSLLFATSVAVLSVPAPAEAQSNCRQRCMDEENACLSRTGNKGQCGHRSSDCMSRCR